MERISKMDTLPNFCTNNKKMESLRNRATGRSDVP